MIEQRVAGVLLHPTSLPSKFVSGTLGIEAIRFLDWMKDAGLSLWQTLPMHPPDGGLSPYSSPSALAGNIFLIDLELLVLDGWLSPADIKTPPQSKRLNSDHLQTWLTPKLELAGKRFADANPDRIKQFIKEEPWVQDWALFSCICADLKVYQWQDFPISLKNRENQAITDVSIRLGTEIQTSIAMQILFFDQWNNIRRAAKERGISIVGDLPIFISAGGVDTWTHPQLFLLDQDGYPNPVAGVPPDAFSETGQHWGNPHYNWEVHEQEHFQWWIQRLEMELRFGDNVRIDHFRGFCSAWAIPRTDGFDARKGTWTPARGLSLFKALVKHFGYPLPFFAEDLGIITPDVDELRVQFGLMGMKILQFAFGEDDHIYQPHNYDSINWVCYTGTHDNNTINGWYESIETNVAHRFLNYTQTDGSQNNWAMISLCLSSKARWAIVPMQDFIGLDGSARMNLPGVGEGQWGWRLDEIPWNITERIRLTVKHFDR